MSIEKIFEELKKDGWFLNTHFLFDNYDMFKAFFDKTQQLTLNQIEVKDPELVDTTDYKVKYFKACIEIEKLKQEQKK